MSRSLLLIIIAALGFIYIWKNCTKIREGLYPCKSNDWTGGPTRCCPVRTGNYKDLRKGADSQLGKAIAAWCKNPIFYDEGKSPPTRTTDGTKFTASYQAAFGCPKGGLHPQHPLELPPSQMQKCSYQGAPAPICDLAAWENNDCAAKFDQQAQGGIAAFRYGEDAPPGGTEFHVGGNQPNCVYAPEAIPLSLALKQDGGLVLQDSPNFCENIQEEGDSGGDTSGKLDCEQNSDVKFWRGNSFFPNMPPSLATYLENNGFGSFCEWGKGEYGENNTLKTGNCPSFQTCNPGFPPKI